VCFRDSGSNSPSGSQLPALLTTSVPRSHPSFYPVSSALGRPPGRWSTLPVTRDREEPPDGGIAAASALAVTRDHAGTIRRPRVRGLRAAGGRGPTPPSAAASAPPVLRSSGKGPGAGAAHRKPSIIPCRVVAAHRKPSIHPLQSRRGASQAIDHPLQSHRGAPQAIDHPLQSNRGASQAIDHPLQSHRGASQAIDHGACRCEIATRAIQHGRRLAGWARVGPRPPAARRPRTGGRRAEDHVGGQGFAAGAS
jgi:hypothetical protein